MAGDWLPEICGVEAQPAPDPAPGLVRLQGLVAAVEGAGSAQEAVHEVAGFLGDAEAMAEALDAFMVSGDAAAGLLTRMGARRGLKGHADRLLSNFQAKVREREVEERRARLRVAQPGETGPPVHEVLGWDGLPEGLVSPPGWSLTPEAVQRVSVDAQQGGVRMQTVAAGAVVLTGRLLDVQDGTTWVRLDWGGEQRHGHRVVPRGQIADARLLPGLANFDAPLHSGNAREMVEYLASFEAHNRDALPMARTSGHMGWQGQDGELGFLWGQSLIRPGAEGEPVTPLEELPPSQWSREQVHLMAEAGAAEIAEGLRPGGTWKGWLGVVSEALPYPSVVLALYASLVPPLMPLIAGLPNFIVDWSGVTSSGKTTSLRLGASVWGSPDERSGGLVRSWDATRVWIERTSATLNCLPMFLDDTKRARRPSQVGQILYDVANGVGRGRGSVKGTRAVTTWRTVLLSTGETPVTSFTQDGGTRARALCLWGSPFGATDKSTAGAVARINAGTLEHHGHAGPKMIAWLLDTPDARDKVREAYRTALGWWAGRADGNPVAGRAAQYLAALTVTRNLLHQVLDVPRPGEDPLELAWAAVCEASQEADRSTEALRDVLSWATSQQGRFHGRLEGEAGSDGDPPGGWLGAWPSTSSWRYLAVLPTELRLLLDRLGYDTEAVLRAWDDREWLLSDSSKRRTRKVAVGKRRERCFVISRAACEQIEGEDDA